MHKMKRVETPLWRCGAEKEMLVYILSEYSVLEKIRMQTLGFARMDQEQIKEAGLSGIVVLGKKAGLLNSHMNLNERYRSMG